MSLGIAMAIGAPSAHLAAAVRSLAAAGVSEIAVADATGDPSTRKSFAPVEDKIAAYFAEPDRGQSDGLNKAFATLRSEFVGWLNDDDFLAEGTARDVAFAAGRDADVVFGETLFLDVRGRALGYHPNIAIDPSALQRGCTISQPSCFFRRQVFVDAGGLDVSLHYVMDWDLWLKMRAAGAVFRYAPLLFSSVTLERAAKTAHLRSARARELYQCGRRHGRAALGAAAFAARAMAGSAVWLLAGAEAPPHPYFELWEKRGGCGRAPDLVAVSGPVLFHNGEQDISRAEIFWRDGRRSMVRLETPVRPFERFRLTLPGSPSDVRAIAL